MPTAVPSPTVVSSPTATPTPKITLMLMLATRHTRKTSGFYENSEFTHSGHYLAINPPTAGALSLIPDFSAIYSRSIGFIPVFIPAVQAVFSLHICSSLAPK
ncbi:hypothetical protein KSP39_PZI007402 [Platanthera zijinensis]|uniref:Uncharacterized protein n=1 Tax=Platanthera zijinensis TaxID=2320716 RepID=A0AAP0G9G3_9ASPA